MVRVREAGGKIEQDMGGRGEEKSFAETWEIATREEKEKTGRITIIILVQLPILRVESYYRSSSKASQASKPTTTLNKQ